jgi:hypothetical protein
MVDTETKVVQYEDAAEIVTGISGWVCKTCRRYWAEDEHMARYCCSTEMPCETKGCAGRRRTHGIIYCDACSAKQDEARWKAIPEVKWDGKTPLVLHDDDTYFFDSDSLRDYLEEQDIKLEDLRVVICEEVGKPSFEMRDLLEDYLPDGLDCDSTEKINAVVERWIDKHVPTVWTSSNARPTLASLKEYVEVVEG